MYKRFGEKGSYDKNNTSLLQPHGKKKQNISFKRLRISANGLHIRRMFLLFLSGEKKVEKKQQPHYLSSDMISKATWIFLKEEKK